MCSLKVCDATVLEVHELVIMSCRNLTPCFVPPGPAVCQMSFVNVKAMPGLLRVVAR